FSKRKLTFKSWRAPPFAMFERRDLARRTNLIHRVSFSHSVEIYLNPAISHFCIVSLMRASTLAMTFFEYCSALAWLLSFGRPWPSVYIRIVGGNGVADQPSEGEGSALAISLPVKSSQCTSLGLAACTMAVSSLVA